jgi:hypothetical protein
MHLFERGWIEHVRESRAVRITELGRRDAQNDGAKRKKPINSNVLSIAEMGISLTQSSRWRGGNRAGEGLGFPAMGIELSPASYSCYRWPE